jgi:hypothetical protein
MHSDLRRRLLAVARGDVSPKAGVTPVTGVTASSGYVSKPLELRQLPGLRPEVHKLETGPSDGVTEPVTLRIHSDEVGPGAQVEECARVVELGGGVPSDPLGAKEFEARLAGWLNENPVTSTPGLCIVCGRGDQPDDIVLPFGTTPPGAAWLHTRCWPTWSRERQNQAVAALTTIGIINSAARKT